MADSFCGDEALATQVETFAAAGEKTAFKVLAAISLCHLMNDMLSSVLPATYPLFKAWFHLNFTQIGLITLTYQFTASLLQPLIGMLTDRRPRPYSLSVGMALSLAGVLMLAAAHAFAILVAGAAILGVGSAVFHPESSRVARMASGGQHGTAQALFQVGGNAGLAFGPLLVALIVMPRGQASIAWFGLAALVGIVLLVGVGGWAKRQAAKIRKSRASHGEHHAALPTKRVVLSIGVLMALLFSKYFYLASLTSYYTFYLISKFHLSVRTSQIYLFVFLGAVAMGTIIGGPIGDRIGRKYVIWCSILGVLPFTLILPYANLFWTGILSVVIGLGAGVGFFGDCGVRAGTGAGAGGNDFGALLRIRFRSGGAGRGHAGRTGGRYEHQPCVSRVLVPARYWSPGGIPAEYRRREAPARGGSGCLSQLLESTA